MDVLRPHALAPEVHGRVLVAVVAFERIVGLQAGPFMPRQFQPLLGELRQDAQLDLSFWCRSVGKFALEPESASGLPSTASDNQVCHAEDVR